MIWPRSTVRLLAGVLFIVACGGRSERLTERTGSENGGGDPVGGSSGTAGASITGGVSGTSGAIGGGTSGAISGGTSGAISGGTGGATSGGTSGTNSGDVCAMMTLSLGGPPTNLFVTVDRSETMSEAWPDVAAALVTLFEDPSLSQLAPTLKFFPDEPSGCDAVNCNADACASPLFPFAELVASRAPADEQEDLLVTALLDTEPVAAEASITLAWRGARDAVAALRTARPEEGGHVLLVTTGGPDTCGGDAALLARLTAAAVEEAGITTFVAAPETTSAREDLDRIALNGGTGEAFLIGPETEGLADLIDALTPVRGTVTCDFALPSAPDSLAFDFERTVMTLTLESDPPIDLRRLSSGEACGNALGWYYDNDSRPTRIVLCVSTCSAVANARHGRIDVGLSCF